MRAEVERDWEWANGLEEQIAEILQAHLHVPATVRRATEHEDLRRATDYVVTSEASVACRMRRPECHWRELTLRRSRPNGSVTELDKLRGGTPRWYLYGWTKPANHICEWILVDCDRLREAVAELSERWADSWQPDAWERFARLDNKDGTTFIAIQQAFLAAWACTVARGREAGARKPSHIEARR